MPLRYCALLLLLLLIAPSGISGFVATIIHKDATLKSTTAIFAQQSSLSPSSPPPFDDNHGQQFTRREAFATSSAAFATTASGLMLPRSAIAATTDNNSNNDEPNPTAAAATATSLVPKVKLGNSNLEVSRTIQGYWQLAGGHGKYKESEALANMEAHYQAGITTLDTADIYGPSELICGRFMAKRPEAQILTKFCCFR